MGGYISDVPYLREVRNQINRQFDEFEERYGKSPKFVKVSEEAFEKFKAERKKILPDMPDDGEPYLFGLRMCVTPTVTGLTGIEVF